MFFTTLAQTNLVDLKSPALSIAIFLLGISVCSRSGDHSTKQPHKYEKKNKKGIFRHISTWVLERRHFFVRAFKLSEQATVEICRHVMLNSRGDACI
jgi:hypothetical protein